MTTSLGISAFYHDSAAALVRDGEIVAAAQEERFSRIRHDPAFPVASIGFCLEQAGVALRDVDHVSYYEDPKIKFRRVLGTAAAMAPSSSAAYGRTLREWIGTKRRTDLEVRERLVAMGDAADRRIRVYPHHLSHAASAFYPSPFRSAAVLCIDGVGEWATTSIWHATDAGIAPVAEVRFPHSLGLLYSAFTYFCGFKVDSGEYKLMGLAPYGTPRFAQRIRTELIDVKDDGSFRLNVDKFEFLRGEVMTGEAFVDLFGGPRRTPEGSITQREFDLAASVQAVTEDVVLRLARTARAQTGERHLCLAGGVALNCVANGVLSRSGVFDEIWVQPAAGDAGGSLGAALLTTYAVAGVTRARADDRSTDDMQGALLGPRYTAHEVRRDLEAAGARFVAMEESALCSTVARDLAAGRIVAWFQGRSEFGPRALGARSILGDPRSEDMQSRMNLSIKFRESFRPFAPSVLEEHAGEYFDIEQTSPYMMIVSPVAEHQRRPVPADSAGLDGIGRLQVPRSSLPAVTHVDYSARVQTVDRRRAPLYRSVIEAFHALTGCPVVVNTSFNVRGEPIVNTPAQAYTCFMRTDIHSLAIGPFYLVKDDQPAFSEKTDWREAIPLD